MNALTCEICQEPLSWKGRGRKPRYCPDHAANGHGARLAARARPEFICVDGEGIRRGATVTEDGYLSGGTHNYILLSAGDQSLWSRDDDTPLRLDEILAFLWAQFEAHPNAVFCGFSLGYDFAQWLKWLPEAKARSLLTDEGRKRRTSENGWEYPVRWQQWGLKMLGSRRLSISRLGDDDRRVLHVSDVFGCFQMPFAKAIADLKMDPAHREIIEYGKRHLRRVTSRDQGRKMIGGRMIGLGEYNVAENKALAMLMDGLATGMARPPLELTLKRDQWYGPGPMVEQWLAGTDDPRREELHGMLPMSFLRACRGSYFGGWFETPVHGPAGYIWNYDINSAYPDVMRSLPCLRHASVRHWDNQLELHSMFGRRSRELPVPPSPWTLVRAEMHGTDKYLGAHLHRARDGHILRPLNTTGLIWWHELAAAVGAGLISAWAVTEAWALDIRCECPPPLAGLQELYDERRKIKDHAKQTGVYDFLEKALKLIYNSGYGKHAQSVGHPKYANPVYASLITAGCRVKVLDAIATHPQRSAAVAMIATDGVYFTSPHPDLPVSGALGEWEAHEYEEMLIWRPGIYWDQKTREAGERVRSGETVTQEDLDEAVPKCRGVPRDEALSLADFGDKAFAAWEPGMEWPRFGLKIEFQMTTLTQALARGKWETAGQVIYDSEPVQLSSGPYTKRCDPHGGADGLWRTRPYERYLLGVMSQEYTRPIGLPEEDSGNEPATEPADVLREAGMEAVQAEEFMTTLHGEPEIL